MPAFPDLLTIGREGECWEWCGALTKGGYGNVWFDKKNQYVHRVVYQIVHGDIPDGLTVDHVCNNRKCANPEHLRVLSQRDNILRGKGKSAWNARKSSCPKCGGPFYVTPSGKRRCRPCSNQMSRDYYYAKRRA